MFYSSSKIPRRRRKTTWPILVIGEGAGSVRPLVLKYCSGTQSPEPEQQCRHYSELKFDSLPHHDQVDNSLDDASVFGTSAQMTNVSILTEVLHWFSRRLNISERDLSLRGAYHSEIRTDSSLPERVLIDRLSLCQRRAK
ncbi:hypothetical protein M413DRAFT_124992 [Hebeloma cylindrosporum]|uniref:Uncharacterized protein n=1 Tax=Hebeloma cylindrosporum TaxID=76867 RepID=A0A0C3CF93_HEBCY|nr:hypothetical protein M413DRAFT_124992 [Hebeloma cylindrosporum h7]